MKFDIVTHHWFFKNAANDGDSVSIKGSLREDNVITLDQVDHHIARL